MTRQSGRNLQAAVCLSARLRLPRKLFISVLWVFSFNSSALTQIAPPGDSDGTARSTAFESHIAAGSTDEKREALFQIRNLRSAAASRLAVPALTDKSEIVRATAASSVVFLSANEALSVLLPLLNDKAEFVRREAAYALGNVGSSNAVNRLIRTVQNDKALEVRNAAAVALGRIGHDAAVPVLTKILQTRPKEDDEFFRRAAARSIGQIAQVVRTGNRKVLTPQNFLPDRYKQIEPPEQPALPLNVPVFSFAVGILIKTLQNNTEAADTRREAAFALGAIGDKSASPALLSARNSIDPYLAEISREALLKFMR